MSKKKEWLMYFVMAILGLTGLNVLLKVFSIAYPVLDYIVVVAGFFVFLAIVWEINQFQFRSLLDLALLSIIIGMLAWLGMGAGAWIPASAVLISQIFNGFLPLITGVIISGIITVLIGLVRLKTMKR